MKIQTKDNLTVCTPDNLRYPTPYILLEQEQWLDPEMELVKKLERSNLLQNITTGRSKKHGIMLKNTSDTQRI